MREVHRVLRLGPVQAILTRRNAYSGIKYCDEPPIFASELMNEPRCVSNSSGPHIQAWIEEMAAHIKSLDTESLQLVLKGFMSLREATKGKYGRKSQVSFYLSKCKEPGDPVPEMQCHC